LPEYSASEARAINNHGQVVGTAESWNVFPPVLYSLLWEVQFEEDGTVSNVTLTDLGLEETVQGGPSDINDTGQIVGTGKFNGRSHGFLLWDGATIWLEPLPGGGQCGASALNSLDDSTGHIQVVGHSYVGDGTKFGSEAVLWDVASGGAVTLTNLSDSNGKGRARFFGASDVNDAGQAVGGSFLWENGTMIELGDVISDDGGLDPGTMGVHAINESGQLVGSAEVALTGATHAYTAYPSSP
jgi:uncharacterized membrane protein